MVVNRTLGLIPRLVCFALLAWVPLAAQYRADWPQQDEFQKIAEDTRVVLQKLDRQLAARQKQGGVTNSAALDALRQDLLDLQTIQNYLLEKIGRTQVSSELDARLDEAGLSLQDLVIATDNMRSKQFDIQPLRDRLEKALRVDPTPLQKPSALLWGAAEPAAKTRWTPSSKGKQSLTLPKVPEVSKASPVATPLLDRLPAEARVNAVSLVNYLETQIAYDPYWGSYRSSDGVVNDGSANDLDSARLLVDLLWEMEVPAKIIHGRVLVETDATLKLLRVADSGAAANVLAAAEIPHEIVLEDGQVRGFRLERFWVEAWLPLSGYRGVEADGGDHAWIPLDPAFSLMGVPDFTDPFSQGNLDSQALLEAYETVEDRDAIAWLNSQIALLTGGADLNQLAMGFTEPPPAPSLLDLSLPYVVEARLGVYDAVPAALEHQVHFQVFDDASQAVLDGQVALPRIYGGITSWDANPFEAADFELVAAYGSRWRVPAHLLQLRPVINYEGQVLVSGNRPLPVGAALSLSMTVTTPSGFSTEIVNPAVAGGFSVLAFQGSTHPLREIDEGEVGPFSPFGNLMYGRTRAWLRRSANFENTLARAMRLALVTPTANLAWSPLAYELSQLDGQPVSLDLKAWRLDGDFKAARWVTTSASMDRARTADAYQLASLVAAQAEGTVLEFRGDEVRAVSVPDLFKRARVAGIVPVDLEPGMEDELATYGLPAEVEEQLAALLTQGRFLRMIPGVFSQEGVPFTAARVLDPDTGRMVWLLDQSYSGASTTTSVGDMLDDLRDALTEPSVDRTRDRDDDVFFLQRESETAHQKVDTDKGEVFIRYQALNSRGRPVPDALVHLRLTNPHSTIPESYYEFTATTDQNGIVEFTVLTPPWFLRANRFLMKLDPANEFNDLVGAFYYEAFVPGEDDAEGNPGSPRVVNNLTSTVLVLPGAPVNFQVFPRSRLTSRASGGAVNNFGTVVQSAQSKVVFYLFVHDANFNIRVNQDVLFESGTDISGNPCGDIGEILAENGLDNFSYTHTFFTNQTEEAELLNTYVWTSRVVGTKVLAKPGVLSRGFFEKGDVYQEYDYEDIVRITAAGQTQEIPILVSSHGGNQDYSVCSNRYLYTDRSTNGPRWGLACSGVGGIADFERRLLLGNTCTRVVFGELDDWFARDDFSWPIHYIRLDQGETRGMSLPIQVKITGVTNPEIINVGPPPELEFIGGDSECKVLVPCPAPLDLDEARELAVAYLYNGLTGTDLPYEIVGVEKTPDWAIAFDVTEPGIITGSVAHYNYVSRDANRINSYSPYYEFFLGAYRATFDESSASPIKVDGTGRQKSDVEIRPKFEPAGFRSSRMFSFELLENDVVINKTVNIGAPGMKFLAGSVWDLNAEYKIRFKFDIDDNGNLLEEGFEGTIPLQVTDDLDLAVFNIENGDLWLDDRPRSQPGAKRAECARPIPAGGEPFFAWNVFNQEFIYNHRLDYDTVMLQAFVDSGMSYKIYETEFPGEGFEPGEIGINPIPVDPNKPFYWPDPALLAEGGLYWRLVGRSANGDKASELRFLPFKLLIEGVGVRAESDNRVVYIPEYNYVLEEDPTGTEAGDCNVVNRDLSFRINHAAVVTFEIDGTTLANETYYEPGEYSFEHEFNFLGKKDWTFRAVFRTEDGQEIVLEREGSVEITQAVRSKLRVGVTSVKGVNLASGSLTVGGLDFLIPGIGGGLAFSRTYSSAGGQNYNPMGIAWNHSYESRLVVSGCQDLKIIGGDGSGMVFKNVGNDQYESQQPGVHSTLTVDTEAQIYTLTTKSGKKFIYDRPIPVDAAGKAALAFPHNLVAIEDPFGNQIQMEYDPLTGLLSRVTDASDRSLVFNYSDRTAGYQLLESVETVGVSPAITVNFEHDEFGRLVEVSRGARRETYAYTEACLSPPERDKLIAYTNPNGYTTTYTWHDEQTYPDGIFPQEFVQSISEPEGLTTNFEYGDQGVNRTAMVSDGIASTSYEFNFHGQPISISGPLGTKTMSWAENDVLMMEETDEAGRSFTYSYDEKGNLISKTQGAYQESWVYDTTWNRPVSHTDARGNTSTWMLNPNNGSVLSYTDGEGNTRTFDYDAQGNVTEMVDANGAIQTMMYDRHGYMVQAEPPDGNTLTRTYDSRGRMTSESDAAGRVTTFTYSDLDFLLTQSTPAEDSEGQFIEYGGHRPMGQPGFRVEGKLRSTFSYDGLNRLTEKRLEPGENQAEITLLVSYDIHGNLLSRTQSGFGSATRTMLHTYDLADRLREVTLNGDPLVSFTYRPGTELVENATDWKGAITQYFYDDLLHLERVIQPTGHVLTYEFDVGGNKTAMVDGNGNRTLYEYDKANRMISMKNALDHETVYTYDPAGNMLSWMNQTTQAGVVFTYDLASRPLSQKVINPTGDQTTSFEYTDFGRTQTVIQPLDTPVVNHMNELGQLITSTQGDIETKFQYDGNGNRKKVDYPEGYEATLLHDGLGRLVEHQMPHDYVERRTFDIYNNVIEFTDRRGVVTESTFDQYDRVTRRTYRYQFGDVAQSAEETWSYSQLNGQVTETFNHYRGNRIVTRFDKLDRVLSIEDQVRGGTETYVWDANNLRKYIDRRGFSTDIAYDPLNRPLTIEDDGGTMAFAYNDSMRQVQTTDRRGLVTLDEYDTVGNLLKRTRSDILQAENAYDQQNRLVRSIDGSGVMTTMSYDPLGRLLSQMVGEQVRTYSNYDLLGRPGRMFDGRNGMDYTYDFYGRSLTRTDDTGATLVYSFDAAGNVLTRTAPSAGHGEVTWSYLYDMWSNIVQVTEPDEAETAFEWTNNWGFLQITDAADQVSSYTYDPAGRLSSLQLPGLGLTEFTYDPNDNRTAVNQPIGEGTFSYDYLNRLLDESWDDNPDPDTKITGITRTRDANGNLTSVTHSGSEGDYTRSITYDDLDRPTDFMDSRGLGISIGYRANGTRAFVRDAHGLEAQYSYDSTNRLSGVRVGDLGTVDYGYFANGQLQSVTRSNGLVTQVDYDPVGRLTELVHTRPNGDETRFEAGYFADGSRQFLTETRTGMGVHHTDYRYDEKSRLTGWTRTTPAGMRQTEYELDAVGNRLSETETGVGFARSRDYTLLTGHRIGGFTEDIHEDGVLVSDRTVTYQYDANGNRTEKINLENVGNQTEVTSMIWDAKNRLRKVLMNGNPSLEFDYDDLNRRIRKAGDSRGEENLLYVWDQLAVLSEFSEDSTGNRFEQASYAFGLLRLAMVRPGQNDQWLAHDMMGSIADITDAGGNLVEAKTYTPFGKEELLFSSAMGGYNRYGFTGHEYDPETKLNYAKARFYDPDLGTFASTDPVMGTHENPPSLHRYMYAFHNPLSYTDPTGLVSVGEALEDLQNEYQDSGQEGKALGIMMVRALWEAFGPESLSHVVDEHLNGDPSNLSVLDYIFAVLDSIPAVGLVGRIAKRGASFTIRKAKVLLGFSDEVHAASKALSGAGKVSRGVDEPNVDFLMDAFKASPEQKLIGKGSGIDDSAGALKRAAGAGDEVPDLVHPSKPKPNKSKVSKERRTGPELGQSRSHAKAPEANTGKGRATTKVESVKAKEPPKAQSKRAAATGTDGAPPRQVSKGSGNGGSGNGGKGSRGGGSGQSPKKEVILDTNAFKGFKESQKLLGPDEVPVLTRQVFNEIVEQVEKGTKSFTQDTIEFAKQFKIVEDVADVQTLSQLRQALFSFTDPKVLRKLPNEFPSLGQIQGLDGDGIIGATAILTGRSIITGDKAFFNALRAFGVDARGIGKKLKDK